jgi:serralysin
MRKFILRMKHMPTVISHDNSVFTTAANAHALDGRSLLATDSLVVAADGFLIATGVGAIGALLNTGPVWKVTINGSVASGQSDGLLLAGGTGSKASTIAIGTEGSVAGETRGLALFGTAMINNAGSIAGGTVAIAATTGTTITNSGLIAGPNAILATNPFGIQKVTNSGTIEGLLDLGGDADILTNSGRIENNVFMGFGDDAITNSGTIKGTANLGNGVNKLTNTGTIATGVIGGSDVDTVTNSGTIGGNVNLGDGRNVLKNTGTISSFNGGIDADVVTNSRTVIGSVSLGDGLNRLTNSGTIGGNILGGSDADNVKNTGTVTGFIDLGLGDDIFTGGAKAEVVRDNGGSDLVKLGAGDDTYRATRPDDAIDGIDTIDGAAGIDTYDARFAETNVVINIDAVAHDFSPLQPGRDAVAANTATGTDIAGAFKDVVRGFENVVGGSRHDIIHGSAAANVLEGGGGDDFLGGHAGNDRLLGGSGLDVLHGGAGKDTLTGGSDIDVFRFASIKDSSVGKANRDIITDFSPDDVIELHFIDADTTNGPATNDSFRFIGTNVTFSGDTGELRAYWTAEGQIVEGDINGDRKADFAIEIVDPTHQIVLTASDFIL